MVLEREGERWILTIRIRGDKGFHSLERTLKIQKFTPVEKKDMQWCEPGADITALVVRRGFWNWDAVTRMDGPVEPRILIPDAAEHFPVFAAEKRGEVGFEYELLMTVKVLRESMQRAA